MFISPRAKPEHFFMNCYFYGLFNKIFHCLREVWKFWRANLEKKSQQNSTWEFKYTYVFSFYLRKPSAVLWKHINVFHNRFPQWNVMALTHEFFKVFKFLKVIRQKKTNQTPHYRHHRKVAKLVYVGRYSLKRARINFS